MPDDIAEIVKRLRAHRAQLTDAGSVKVWVKELDALLDAAEAGAWIALAEQLPPLDLPVQWINATTNASTIGSRGTDHVSGTNIDGYEVSHYTLEAFTHWRPVIGPK
jgi:hypothetical protein